MFYYFGGKGDLVGLYPRPAHRRVIEPFAGSAKYACKYFDHEVWLNDLNPIIVTIWRWLKYATPADIRQLPVLVLGETLDDYKYLSTPERYLLGFCICYGNTSPRTKVTSSQSTRGGRQTLNFKANFLKIAGKISHWKITGKSYADMENEEACWYIDPPYQNPNMGKFYTFSNKMLNYLHLAKWCRQRQGQVIVCEASGATWLPFAPLTRTHTSDGSKDYHEVVYLRGCPKTGIERLLHEKNI